MRTDWRQEWEAELRYREALLAEWDQLNWRTKLDLLWHSAGALMDALWLQPQRWEDEMFGVLSAERFEIQVDCATAKPVRRKNTLRLLNRLFEPGEGERAQ